MFNSDQPQLVNNSLTFNQGCQRKLDPLLTYPAWVRRTLPTGISNDVMGSVPHHPFFLKVIDALPRYDRSWGLPYITVMGSTGPLFLSVIWRHYNSGAPVPEQDRVRILFPDEYSKHSWSFFKYHVGNSWHKGDVRLILWVRYISESPHG
jgi:mannosyltransferase OCH1-like enzyme